MALPLRPQFEPLWLHPGSLDRTAEAAWADLQRSGPDSALPLRELWSGSDPGKRQPSLLVIGADSGWLGALLLDRSETAWGGLRIRTWSTPRLAQLGAHRPPFTPVLQRPRADRFGLAPALVADALADAVVSAREWDRCRFEALPHDSLFAQALVEAAARRRWRVVVRRDARRIRIELAGGWDRALARASALRQRIVQRHAADFAAGRLRLDEIRDRNGLLDAFPAIFGIGSLIETHSDSHREQRLAARREFRDVALRLAERGSLSLFLLSIEGRPVAYSLQSVADGVAVEIDAALHPRASQLDERPLDAGQLLLGEALRRHSARGVRAFEAFAEPDAATDDWAGQTRDLCTISLFRDTLPGRLLAARARWSRRS